MNHYNRGALALVCLAVLLPGAVQAADTALVDVDGDGAADVVDECPDTAAGTLVDRKGCPARIPPLPADLAPPPEVSAAAAMPAEATPAPVPELPAEAAAPVATAPTATMAPEPVAAPAAAPVVLPAATPSQSAPPAAQLRRIPFDSGSAKLNSEARRALDNVLQALRAAPGLQLDVVGHNLPGEGGGSYLPQARANAVRTFLVDLGIDGSRLRATAKAGGAAEVEFLAR